MMKRRSTTRGAKSTKSAGAAIGDPIDAEDQQSKPSRADARSEDAARSARNENAAMKSSDGDFPDPIEESGENADTAGAEGPLDAEGEIALMVLATGDVARRAYELFLARGQAHGQDLDDWLTAERELREAQQASRQHG